MCIFSTAFQLRDEAPLLIVANRDESRSRPTAPPRVNLEEVSQTAWIGGVDLQLGGTWLGVSEAGFVVAVTNRPKQEIPPSLRSRGLLCRDLLQQPSIKAAKVELQRQMNHYPFAGFNALLFSPQAGWVFESGDDPRVHELKPGIHTIANGSLDDPNDPRVMIARQEAENAIRDYQTVDDWVQRAQRMASWHAIEDSEDAPGLCLHRNGWGTVSSTILVLAADSSVSRYHYAAGPPCVTSYDDYTSLLRSLLRRESSGVVPFPEANRPNE